jgi:hypothetical protein
MFEYCIVGDADYEGKTLTRGLVKARKQYVCCECHGDILPGQSYERAKGVWSGGGFWAQHTCVACSRVRDSLMRGSWAYGELWDSVNEHFCKTDEDREAMLPEGYLARVYGTPAERGLCPDYSTDNASGRKDP